MTNAVLPRSRRRRWTYADYCRIPPEMLRHEIMKARVIDQLVLRDRRYASPVVCSERIRLRMLRGVEVDLRRVW